MAIVIMKIPALIFVAPVLAFAFITDPFGLHAGVNSTGGIENSMDALYLGDTEPQLFVIDSPTSGTYYKKFTGTESGEFGLTVGSVGETSSPSQSFTTYISTGGVLTSQTSTTVSGGDLSYSTTPPSSGVGGLTLPVDKFSLLAPYIGLASTILVATAATAIYVRRVKRRKEKQ